MVFFFFVVLVLVLAFFDGEGDFVFLYIFLTMLVSADFFLFSGLSPNLLIMTKTPSQVLDKLLRLNYWVNKLLWGYGD